MPDNMYQAILSLPEHLSYEPKVQNQVGPISFEKFVFLGMGGSGLVGEAMRYLKPEMDIVVHKDYGLPPVADLAERLLICVSYSGNTEEVIDGFKAGLEGGHNLAVITTGGKLLEQAKEAGVLYIELPDTGIQPRASLGLQVKAACAVTGQEELAQEIEKIDVNPQESESRGQEIAQNLKGKVPLIYASRQNTILAYFFKIAMNETGKIPAFWDVFPELNHNELTGFDINREDSELSDNIAVILLRDSEDDDRIEKRMTVLAEMYRKRSLPVYDVEVDEGSRAQKLFKSMVLAEWAAYHIAQIYGSDPDAVPMVEEFKKEIKE